jgi:hypothetical protein
MWRGTGHQSLRQDHRRLFPLGRQPSGPQGPDRLRAQRSNAVTWASRLCADARARGKRNPHTTRIVAHAWLRVIWACWHTGTHMTPRSPRRTAPRSRLT